MPIVWLVLVHLRASYSLPVSSACKAQRWYENQSRRLNNEGEKNFSALRADGSTLHASMHYLQQCQSQYKIASYYPAQYQHPPSTFLDPPLHHTWTHTHTYHYSYSTTIPCMHAHSHTHLHTHNTHTHTYTHLHTHTHTLTHTHTNTTHTQHLHLHTHTQHLHLHTHTQHTHTHTTHTHNTHTGWRWPTWTTRQQGKNRKARNACKLHLWIVTSGYQKCMVENIVHGVS